MLTSTSVFQSASVAGRTQQQFQPCGKPRTVNDDWQGKELPLYKYRPPAHWPALAKGAIRAIHAMLKDPRNNKILLSCSRGVMLSVDTANYQTAYQYHEVLKEEVMHALGTDQKNRVWVGTQSGALYRSKGDSYEKICTVNSRVNKIFTDDKGWLWIATTTQGLIAIDAETGQVLQHYTIASKQNALYAEGGESIEQLNDSIIVFGAGALNFINKKNGAVSIIGYEQGLPSNNVKRIRRDRQGYLWLVTSAGLCRYNPWNGRITQYGRKDGVIQGSQATEADLITAKGEILFAGNSAMLRIDPTIFNTRNTVPAVSITDFKLFNNFLPLDSLQQLPRITLKHDENSFSIYFASLSFTQRDKLIYYYRMDGIDTAWKIADRSDYENYPLLPPGAYQFNVYAESIDGTRSEITQLQLYIQPPFWRTWWFSSLVLLAIAGAIYWLHSIRVKSLLAVVNVRNRVARDLHDDMGSTLSTINILSSMAKTKMGTDPVKVTEYIGKISDNSQRMMESMDDIVWSITPANDSMQKIVARMREFGTYVLEPKDILPDIAADEKVYHIKLNMEIRRDLFLIFKEAVNNVAKYSAATKLKVRLAVTEKGLEMIIEDDGKGFDIALATGQGNGLGNMEKRAAAIGALLNIQSAPGAGTRIIMLIPF